jgi:hypothetical protein
MRALMFDKTRVRAESMTYDLRPTAVKFYVIYMTRSLNYLRLRQIRFHQELGWAMSTTLTSGVDSVHTHVTADTLTWREIVRRGAPTPRSSHQLSSHGTALYLFGGENGPEHSHFGYGEPVDPAVYSLNLSSQPGDEHAWREVAVTASSFLNGFSRNFGFLRALWSHPPWST